MVQNMKIELDNKNLRYTGRIDDSNPKKPEFIFAATSLEFCFRGTKAALTVTNRRQYWNSYIGVIVDGKQRCMQLNESGTTVLELVNNLSEAKHTVMVFKRMDCCHEIVLEELELDGELLAMPERPARRIEVYGDSVSAGEVVEALDYLGKEDPEHEGQYSNSWYSYSWQTARRLGAELHNIAQGGIALLNGTGWFNPPDYVGMESAWDKVHYNPEFGECTKWDFTRYRPQLVIVAIGQNDSNPYDYMKEDPKGEEAANWKRHYRDFLCRLREVYPQAYILSITTLLQHDRAWDDAIDEVCRQINDKRLSHYMFRRNGSATPGHLRIPEAQEMAEELESYIQGLGIQW